jgi:hypothetical protein
MSNQTRQKLTVSDVIDIRRHHANGISSTALGNIYGIDRRHVSDIVAGERWASVPNDKTIPSFNNYALTADGRVYSNTYGDYVAQEMIGGQPYVRLSKTVKGTRVRKRIAISELVNKLFD